MVYNKYFDDSYLDYDDFSANTGHVGGGKRGTTGGTNKDKESGKGTIYSSKHTRMYEAQRAKQAATQRVNKPSR
jgi:hypothetical protein